MARIRPYIDDMYQLNQEHCVTMYVVDCDITFDIKISGLKLKNEDNIEYSNCVFVSKKIALGFLQLFEFTKADLMDFQDVNTSISEMNDSRRTLLSDLNETNHYESDTSIEDYMLDNLSESGDDDTISLPDTGNSRSGSCTKKRKWEDGDDTYEYSLEESSENLSKKQHKTSTPKICKKYRTSKSTLKTLKPKDTPKTSKTYHTPKTYHSSKTPNSKSKNDTETIPKMKSVKVVVEDLKVSHPELIRQLMHKLQNNKHNDKFQSAKTSKQQKDKHNACVTSQIDDKSKYKSQNRPNDDEKENISPRAMKNRHKDAVPEFEELESTPNKFVHNVNAVTDTTTTTIVHNVNAVKDTTSRKSTNNVNPVIDPTPNKFVHNVNAVTDTTPTQIVHNVNAVKDTTTRKSTNNVNAVSDNTTRKSTNNVNAVSDNTTRKSTNNVNAVSDNTTRKSTNNVNAVSDNTTRKSTNNVNAVSNTTRKSTNNVNDVSDNTTRKSTNNVNDVSDNTTRKSTNNVNGVSDNTTRKSTHNVNAVSDNTTRKSTHNVNPVIDPTPKKSVHNVNAVTEFDIEGVQIIDVLSLSELYSTDRTAQLSHHLDGTVPFTHFQSQTLIKECEDVRSGNVVEYAADDGDDVPLLPSPNVVPPPDETSPELSVEQYSPPMICSTGTYFPDNSNTSYKKFIQDQNVYTPQRDEEAKTNHHKMKNEKTHKYRPKRLKFYDFVTGSQRKEVTTATHNKNDTKDGNSSTRNCQDKSYKEHEIGSNSRKDAPLNSDNSHASESVKHVNEITRQPVTHNEKQVNNRSVEHDILHYMDYNKNSLNKTVKPALNKLADNALKLNTLVDRLGALNKAADSALNKFADSALNNSVNGNPANSVLNKHTDSALNKPANGRKRSWHITQSRENPQNNNTFHDNLPSNLTPTTKQSPPTCSKTSMTTGQNELITNQPVSINPYKDQNSPVTETPIVTYSDTNNIPLTETKTVPYHIENSAKLPQNVPYNPNRVDIPVSHTAPYETPSHVPVSLYQKTDQTTESMLTTKIELDLEDCMYELDDDLDENQDPSEAYWAQKGTAAHDSGTTTQDGLLPSYMAKPTQDGLLPSYMAKPTQDGLLPSYMAKPNQDGLLPSYMAKPNQTYVCEVCLFTSRIPLDFHSHMMAHSLYYYCIGASGPTMDMLHFSIDSPDETARYENISPDIKIDTNYVEEAVPKRYIQEVTGLRTQNGPKPVVTSPEGMVRYENISPDIKIDTNYVEEAVPKRYIQEVNRNGLKPVLTSPDETVRYENISPDIKTVTDSNYVEETVAKRYIREVNKIGVSGLQRENGPKPVLTSPEEMPRYENISPDIRTVSDTNYVGETVSNRYVRENYNTEVTGLRRETGPKPVLTAAEAVLSISNSNNITRLLSGTNIAQSVGQNVVNGTNLPAIRPTSEVNDSNLIGIPNKRNAPPRLKYMGNVTRDNKQHENVNKYGSHEQIKYEIGQVEKAPSVSYKHDKVDTRIHKRPDVIQNEIHVAKSSAAETRISSNRPPGSGRSLISQKGPSLNSSENDLVRKTSTQNGKNAMDNKTNNDSQTYFESLIEEIYRGLPKTKDAKTVQGTSDHRQKMAENSNNNNNSNHTISNLLNASTKENNHNRNNQTSMEKDSVVAAQTLALGPISNPCMYPKGVYPYQEQRNIPHKQTMQTLYERGIERIQQSVHNRTQMALVPEACMRQTTGNEQTNLNRPLTTNRQTYDTMNQLPQQNVHPNFNVNKTAYYATQQLNTQRFPIPNSQVQNNATSLQNSQFSPTTQQVHATHAQVHTSEMSPQIPPQQVHATHAHVHTSEMSAQIPPQLPSYTEHTRNNNQRFMCILCHYKTTDFLAFSAHVDHHLQTKTCTICSYQCESSVDLMKHLKYHKIFDRPQINGNYRTQEAVQGYQHSNTQNQSQIQPNNGSYISQSSNNSKNNRLPESTTNNLHPNYQYSNNTNAPLQGNVHADVRNITRNKERAPVFECGVCRRCFKKITELQEHLKIHDPKCPKTFQCYFCGHCYETIVALNEHIKTHKDDNIYQCTLCTFSCSNFSTFHDHRILHKVSTFGYVFKCVLCSYSGKAAHHFQDHMQKHLGRLTVRKCSLCEYVTEHSRSLTRHMSRYHPSSSSKGHKTRTGKPSWHVPIASNSESGLTSNLKPQDNTIIISKVHTPDKNTRERTKSRQYDAQYDAMFAAVLKHNRAKLVDRSHLIDQHNIHPHEIPHRDRNENIVNNNKSINTINNPENNDQHLITTQENRPNEQLIGMQERYHSKKNDNVELVSKNNVMPKSMITYSSHEKTEQETRIRDQDNNIISVVAKTNLKEGTNDASDNSVQCRRRSDIDDMGVVSESNRNQITNHLQEIMQHVNEQSKNEQQKIEQQDIAHQEIEQQVIAQQKIEQQVIEQHEIEQEEIEQQVIEQQDIEQQDIEQQDIEQEEIEQQEIEQEEIEQQEIGQRENDFKDKEEKRIPQGYRIIAAISENSHKEMTRHLQETATLESPLLTNGLMQIVNTSQDDPEDDPENIPGQDQPHITEQERNEQGQTTEEERHNDHQNITEQHRENSQHQLTEQEKHNDLPHIFEQEKGTNRRCLGISERQDGQPDITEPERENKRQEITQQEKQDNHQNITEQERQDNHQNITEQERQDYHQNLTDQERENKRQAITEQERDHDHPNIAEQERDHDHPNIGEQERDHDHPNIAEQERDHDHPNIAEQERDHDHPNIAEQERHKDHRDITEQKRESNQQDVTEQMRQVEQHISELERENHLTEQKRQDYHLNLTDQERENKRQEITQQKKQDYHQNITEQERQDYHQNITEQERQDYHRNITEQERQDYHRNLTDQERQDYHRNLPDQERENMRRAITEQERDHDHPNIAEQERDHDHPNIAEQERPDDHPNIAEQERDHDHPNIAEQERDHDHPNIAEQERLDDHPNIAEQERDHDHPNIAEQERQDNHQNITEQERHNDHRDITEQERESNQQDVTEQMRQVEQHISELERENHLTEQKRQDYHPNLTEPERENKRQEITEYEKHNDHQNVAELERDHDHPNVAEQERQDDRPNISEQKRENEQKQTTKQERQDYDQNMRGDEQERENGQQQIAEVKATYDRRDDLQLALKIIREQINKNNSESTESCNSETVSDSENEVMQGEGPEF